MTFNSVGLSYDVFDDDSLSDEGGNTSSEDEIDIILNGTPEQRKQLQLHHSRRQERNSGQELRSGKHDAQSSSEDEFEKEMNAELSQEVKVLEDSRGKRALAGSKTSQDPVSAQCTDQVKDKNQRKTARNQFYDEVYFDSDDDDDTAGTPSPQKKTHAVMSNDELLYDPDMDDEDQKWVDKQRQSHRGPDDRSVGVTKGRKVKMPNSDALLDCPACMTTLCIDCQRHETYKHQYRAMFVMNCVVDKSEQLQCPEQASKKKKHKKNVSQGTPQQSDLFNPVRCTECNTVVGVADKDEVYHFFNVLASYT